MENKTINIAYGISAYKDPVHLARLVKVLSSPSTLFFIHIDRKVDIKPFEEALIGIPQCIFTKKRYNVYWGGYNQVKYQLLFLCEMINHPKHIDRIFIITGQDYPLWSNETISMQCTKMPNKIWMRGLNLTQLKGYSHMKRFLSVPHYWRDTNFHSLQLRHFITSGQRELFLRIMPNIRKSYVYIDEKICDIWQASGYFSCNREVAEYIIKIIERNPKMANYFKHSFVPEEITIPTIIFNSEYKDDAEVFAKTQYEGLGNLAALHKFYYSKSIKIYSKHDYNSLINSGKMFCRKVETGFSDSLLDMIDLYREQF